MSLPQEPYSRIERYLARLAGQDVDIPDKPITRIECYLDYLCGNGGGVPAANAGAHNSTFRDQSLGNALTLDQGAAIVAGTFDGLYIGDYWTINNTVYRIAGFDLYLGYGSTPLTKHHAVIVPDAPLGTGAMNQEATTTSGYSGSDMRVNGLAEARTTIQADFGAHVVSHVVLACNGSSNGAPLSWAWVNSTVDLMTESMILGRGAWGTQNQNAYNIGINYNQLPLFHLAPQYVVSDPYWLQDIRNATQFSYINRFGACVSSNANETYGVRPYFLIA